MRPTAIFTREKLGHNTAKHATRFLITALGSAIQPRKATTVRATSTKTSTKDRDGRARTAAEWFDDSGATRLVIEPKIGVCGGRNELLPIQRHPKERMNRARSGRDLRC